MHAATGDRYPHVRVHKRIRPGHAATQLGSPARAARAHDTVCTTACRTSHDLPVQPGVIPLGRQPVSPTPSAPRRRGAHDPGHAPGQENAAVTGSSPGAPDAGLPGQAPARPAPAPLDTALRAAGRGADGDGRLPVHHVHPARPAGPGHQAGRSRGDPVAGQLDRRALRRRRGVGRDPVGGDLPPEAHRRRAAAGPLQPADRDHVHGHPVHHGRRLLLLHRPGRELHRQAPAASGRHRDRVRLPVELGVPVPGVQGAGLGERGGLRDRGALAGPAAAAGDPHEPDRPLQPRLPGRGSLVLDRPVRVQARRDPWPPQPLRGDPDQDGHASSAAAPSCAASTTAGCCSR